MEEPQDYGLCHSQTPAPLPRNERIHEFGESISGGELLRAQYSAGIQERQVSRGSRQTMRLIRDNARKKHIWNEIVLLPALGGVNFTGRITGQVSGNLSDR